GAKVRRTLFGSSRNGSAGGSARFLSSAGIGKRAHESVGMRQERCMCGARDQTERRARKRAREPFSGGGRNQGVALASDDDRRLRDRAGFGAQIGSREELQRVVHHLARRLAAG